MPEFRAAGNELRMQMGRETLRVRPWGQNAVRVQGTCLGGFAESTHALLEPASAGQVQVTADRDSARLRCGRLQVTIDAAGRLSFRDLETGRSLLQESEPRRYTAVDLNALSCIQLQFRAVTEERFYGLGQHGHGRLDQKGCVIDLVQRNGEVAVPVLISTLRYLFLWNMPGLGRVELAHNGTRWVADGARQFDFWLCAGSDYRDLLGAYALATGHPTPLPDWATGFWQSKLRYASQDELLGVAREYRRRDLPLSVIAADYFHWPMMGDFRFDPGDWPDPGGMVRELAGMGVELLVSVWPTINPASDAFEQLKVAGGLLGTRHGDGATTEFFDVPLRGRQCLYHYDPSSPQARRWLWERIREGYGRHGVRAFWLDACEPELSSGDYRNLSFAAGSGLETGCHYPKWHQQAFFEGLRESGEDGILTLCRSAWAGSQRYGAAVWSGDIESSFQVLRAQVRGGLNMGLSGIPWWTTDIGGFHGGDPRSAEFRELIVRWFQFGALCPLFRLHGKREPGDDRMGADNEVWSFGDEAYGIICGLLRLRERLRPYIRLQAAETVRTGVPLMRPLFVDFPEDQDCYWSEDSFLLGDSLLVAPVVEEGARSRMLYLPAGDRWTCAWTGRSYQGGREMEVEAPLQRVPLFLRDGVRLPICPPSA